MVKHTPTIRQLLPTSCLCVFDHSVGLALKGFNCRPTHLNCNTPLENVLMIMSTVEHMLPGSEVTSFRCFEDCVFTGKVQTVSIAKQYSLIGTSLVQ